MMATTGQLTLKDIAELAQVSRPAVSNWRKRYSDFPEPVEESTPRKPLFEATTVVAWLKRNDFLPEDAEQELLHANLWSVANLLRNEIGVDSIPLVVLTLLALDNDPAFEPSDEFDHLKARISATTLEAVQRGIAKLRLNNHSEAAQLIVDRFLGIGARGMRSQYGTTNSLSSAAVVAAASTTTQDVTTVIDPACGIAGTLVGVGEHAPGARLLGADINGNAASLARVFVHLSGHDARIVTGDSIVEDPFADVQANLIVCEPPLAVRIPREDLQKLQRSYNDYSLRGLGTEELFLLYGIQHLAPGGHAYIVTGLSPTSRELFKEHRQRLIAEGRVEAVIEFPSGMFSATRVPAALWVLSADEVTEPLLIDASDQSPEVIPTRIGEWLTAARNRESTDVPYRAVTLADVVTNDGSLCPSTYLAKPVSPEEAGSTFDAALQQLEKTTKELMRIRNPRVSADAIPPSTTSTTLDDLIKSGHFESIAGTYRADKELQTGKARLASANRNAAPAFVKDFDAGDVLRPGDIVMPRHGSSDAWVLEDDGQTWVLSLHARVLRPTSDEYDPYFIATCLNAPVNIDTSGVLPRRLPLTRIAIPELSRNQRAIIADTNRSLDQARSVALQLERDAKHASTALLNLVYAGK